MGKSSLTILIIGVVGAVLLSVMYWHLAESDPGIAPRLETAQLLRRMFQFRSATIAEAGEGPARTLRVTVLLGPHSHPEAWSDSALKDVADFVDLHFSGDRSNLRQIRVTARRELGSGCGRVVEELELSKPVPVTPPRTPTGRPK